MKENIVIGLVQNIAVLLTFAMIYENFWLKKEDSSKIYIKILTGFFLGIIGIVIMYTPWTLIPGLVFDTRSIMLAISGLFFGTIPTLIAIIVTSIMRIIIGGPGAIMGIAVIISSGLIGLLWRRFRSKWKENNIYIELTLLGLTVHVVMLACTLFLPSDRIIPTIKTIILPIFFIYTPGTILLGMLMAQQSNNYQNRIAKEKLYETERNLTQILKSSNIVSIILDTKGRLTFCNQYLLDLTGYTRDEVLNQNWFDKFIKSDNVAELKEIFLKNSEENLKEQNENSIIDKNGKDYTISWHNARLVNAKNQFIGFTCIGVNITDQRKYEQELKDQILKFSELSGNYLIQNKELEKAKAKAEESDKLKSAFLANLSHEIRTPMNAIMGFTELLSNPSLNPDKKDLYINIVRNSGNHLLTIINDIIEISKIEARQVEQKKQDIDIDTFLDELYNTIKVTIPSNKNIELKLTKTYSLKNTIISIDDVKLRQILINLLNNAIKFTEKGTIKFGYIITSSDKIDFFVEDTGIGIDEKYHSIIFDRFRQVDNDISKSQGGSGLGLAISKAYIELMGGKIQVNSEIGKGTNFSFTIPVVEGNMNFKPASANNSMKDEINSENNGYILVAEDDEINFFYLKEVLSFYDYKILWAKTGNEAVDLFQKNYSNIQLVLMDIKMPEMNGYDALKAIKEINPKIPILAQTAYALTDDVKQLKESDFDDYITKPIKNEDLIRKVKQMTSRG